MATLRRAVIEETLVENRVFQLRIEFLQHATNVNQ